MFDDFRFAKINDFYMFGSLNTLHIVVEYISSIRERKLLNKFAKIILSSVFTIKYSHIYYLMLRKLHKHLIISMKITKKKIDILLRIT